MRFADLTPFNLLWTIGGGAYDQYPSMRISSTFKFNQPFYLHAIFGSGLIHSGAYGPFAVSLVPYREDNDITIVTTTNVLFSMFANPSANTPDLGINGQVWFREKIMIEANQPISVYKAQPTNIGVNGTGLITLLTEVI